MPTLPPLRDVIKKFNLRANKSLGQNYLLDKNLNEKIARHLAPEGAIVMEIGPGPAGLTRALLAQGVKKLFVVELDKRFIPALEELQKVYPERLHIIHGDGLKINFKDYNPEIITGNLPFNITSPLLGRCLEEASPSFNKIVVLVQKEVAERIVASHATRVFGRLSVLCQWRGKARTLFTISAHAFTPRPKIDGALVEITLEPHASDPSPQAIDFVCRLAFSQRRKMLRTHKELIPLLEKLNIDSRLRAEQLSVEQYRALAMLV
jgi:16S rRNA (adenine1518-N6/adenine1519-N6)-dimethyltransferase